MIFRLWGAIRRLKALARFAAHGGVRIRVGYRGMPAGPIVEWRTDPGRCRRSNENGPDRIARSGPFDFGKLH
jgi:hypothetical protein